MLHRKSYLFFGCLSAITMSFLLSGAEDNSATQTQTADQTATKVQINTPSPDMIQSTTRPAGYISISDFVDAMSAKQARMMDQIMNSSFYGGKPDYIIRTSYPQSKFVSKNDKYILQFVVPGIDKKDINIKLENRILTVSYEASKETDKKSFDGAENYENYTNQFIQSITIPADVDMDKISSSYKDGILTVNLPRMELQKQSQSKSIQID